MQKHAPRRLSAFELAKAEGIELAGLTGDLFEDRLQEHVTLAQRAGSRDKKKRLILALSCAAQEPGVPPLQRRMLASSLKNMFTTSKDRDVVWLSALGLAEIHLSAANPQAAESFRVLSSVADDRHDRMRQYCARCALDHIDTVTKLMPRQSSK